MPGIGCEGSSSTPFVIGRPGGLPRDLSEALFDGAIVAFRELDSLDALIARTRTLVENIFGTDDPEHVEAHLPSAQFAAAAQEARDRVAADREIQAAWRRVLAEIGYGNGSVFGDRMRLRIVPSRMTAQSTIAMPLDAHRDSWGSGIAAQVNWWLPLYKLAPTRTMLIWPDLFRTPVPNTSGAWDFRALQESRKAGSDYPLLPTAGEAPPERDALLVLPDPGTLLAFSAAQLHGSRADASGITRLSLDTRTYWQGDIAAGRGAPNVDGAPRAPHWSWFQKLDGKAD